ncbi:hypothetical protein KY284_007846 [Solanum tuberosum]|nr:hypothetical protein KY284_007846 [Solanum tuberosum]
MTSPSKNLNLEIIPFENQEISFILPDVMLIDSFNITHLAYPVMEEGSIKGDERNQSLVSDSSENMATYSSGKCIATFVDSPQEDPFSKPSVAISVRLIRSVQRDLDAVLHTKSTKKSRGEKSMFVPPLKPVYNIDYTIEPKKDRKRKRNGSMGSSKEQVTSAKSVKKSSYHKNSDGDIEGNQRRKMGRKETREFYINVVQSTFFISSNFGGMSFTLTAEKQSKILSAPNIRWCHYVKQNWPPLEGLSSALEMSRWFANDPMLEDYTRVDK